jgi:serine/threonine-protein kinase
MRMSFPRHATSSDFSAPHGDDWLKLGTLLDGKFLLERVLGEGGMGVVVRARHIVLDQRFAVKFLKPELAANKELVRRFQQEARATAMLRSAHVGRVFDVSSTDRGIPFIVMEYLEGRDLGRLLAERRHFDVETACDYIIQACDALADAHAHGIVHRDLKPENLFLVQRAEGAPLLKVLDFGISKLPRPSEAGRFPLPQATSLIMGSPLYMSPEQLRSTHEADHRSDVWSLGVVLFELLSGQHPFDAQQHLANLVTQVLEGAPRSLKSVARGIPEALEGIVARCLARDREARLGDVTELALALAPFSPPSSRLLAERLGALAAQRGGRSSVLPPLIRESRPSAPPAPVAHRTDSASTSAAGGAQALSVAVPARPTRRLSKGLLALCMVGALGYAAAWYHVRRSEGGMHAAPPAAASTLDRTRDESAPAAPSTRLTVHTVPEHAAVFLDGVRLDSRTLTLARDTATHEVRAEAPGYITETRRVTFAAHVSLLLALERERNSPRGKPAAAPSSRSRVTELPFR